MTENTQPKRRFIWKIIDILFIIGLIVAGYYGYLYIADTFFNETDGNKDQTVNEEFIEDETQEDGSTGSQSETDEESDDATEVEITEILEEPLARINFQKVGIVNPYKSVTIVSETSGNIKNFTKSEGDEVKKGTKIVEISDSASTKIAQINYDNAETNLEFAKRSLESTKDSTNQDEYSALVGAQTALLNYQNTINSYNNLVHTLEEQTRSTMLSIQAAENGFSAAEESYYNNIATNEVTLENTLDQSLGGVISALTMVDNSIEAVDDLYGVRRNADNDLEEVLDDYASNSTVRNLRNDSDDINDKYYDLYDEYQDLRKTDDAYDLQNLIYNTTELLEDTQSLLYDTKSIINDVLDEDEENVQAVEMTLVTIKSTASTMLSSIDQSKSGLRQSSQGIDSVLINNQIQPEGAFNQLESAGTQLASAKQGLKQVEAGNQAQLDSARHAIDIAAKQLESANAQVNSMKAKSALQEIGAENQVSQLEGQLDVLQTNLDSTKIAAPMNGLILEKFIDEGNYINPGQKIATVADMSKIKITVSLTAEELTFVKLGQTVNIEVPGSKKTSGRITKVLPSIDPVSKKIGIEIIIPNDNNSFKSGMFADVSFPDAQKESPTISVPFKSIVFKNNTPYIYIVENGKAVKVQVKLGQISGNMVEIIDGISKGNKVITKGSKLVEDGESVKVVSS